MVAAQTAAGQMRVATIRAEARKVAGYTAVRPIRVARPEADHTATPVAMADHTAARHRALRPSMVDRTAHSVAVPHPAAIPAGRRVADIPPVVGRAVVPVADCCSTRCRPDCSPDSSPHRSSSYCMVAV